MDATHAKTADAGCYSKVTTYDNDHRRLNLVCSVASSESALTIEFTIRSFYEFLGKKNDDMFLMTDRGSANIRAAVNLKLRNLACLQHIKADMVESVKGKYEYNVTEFDNFVDRLFRSKTEKEYSVRARVLKDIMPNAFALVTRIKESGMLWLGYQTGGEFKQGIRSSQSVEVSFSSDEASTAGKRRSTYTTLDVFLHSINENDIILHKSAHNASSQSKSGLIPECPIVTKFLSAIYQQLGLNCTPYTIQKFNEHVNKLAASTATLITLDELQTRVKDCVDESESLLNYPRIDNTAPALSFFLQDRILAAAKAEGALIFVVREIVTKQIFQNDVTVCVYVDLNFYCACEEFHAGGILCIHFTTCYKEGRIGFHMGFINKYYYTEEFKAYISQKGIVKVFFAESEVATTMKAEDYCNFFPVNADLNETDYEGFRARDLEMPLNAEVKATIEQLDRIKEMLNKRAVNSQSMKFIQGSLADAEQTAKFSQRAIQLNLPVMSISNTQTDEVLEAYFVKTTTQAETFKEATFKPPRKFGRKRSDNTATLAKMVGLQVSFI